MDVSIIIVNYNTINILCNCIDSIIKETKDITFEIIISDNGSTDNSISILRDKYSNLIIIDNKKNLGFGQANNKGLNIAKGKYVFYLNSDTLLQNNAIKIFFDYWENNPEKLGAIGCNLSTFDGRIACSYGQFPTFKQIYLGVLKTFFLVYCLNFVSYNKRKQQIDIPKREGAVDYIIGADLFMLNNDFARFDERYFMFYEETDLQLRLNSNGLKRILISGPKIIHLEGASYNRSNIKRIKFSSPSLIYSYISSIRYLKKNTKCYFRIFLLQLTISIIWLLPNNIKNNISYIKQLWN